MASVEKDEFKYLPYLFFILADFCYDKDLEGKQRESAIFYELAIYLLDIVPNNEKFADPYYKLAKLKERENKLEEAITLYIFAGTIDKSYNVEKDIKRVTSLYEGGGNTDDEGEDNDREMPLIDFF